MRLGRTACGQCMAADITAAGAWTALHLMNFSLQLGLSRCARSFCSGVSLAIPRSSARSSWLAGSSASCLCSWRKSKMRTAFARILAIAPLPRAPLGCLLWACRQRSASLLADADACMQAL